MTYTVSGGALNSAQSSPILKYPVSKPYLLTSKKKEFSFGLSCEDVQDKNDWRLRMKGSTA